MPHRRADSGAGSGAGGGGRCTLTVIARDRYTSLRTCRHSVRTFLQSRDDLARVARAFGSEFRSHVAIVLFVVPFYPQSRSLTAGCLPE